MSKSKSSLDISDVLHVAQLAKLKLSHKDLKNFQKQLSDILQFVAQLSQVDTTNIEPTSQVTGLENVFRDDEVRRSLTQEEALANAPSTYNGFIKVKAVLEE